MKEIDEQLELLAKTYNEDLLLNACRNIVAKHGDKQEIDLRLITGSFNGTLAEFGGDLSDLGNALCDSSATLLVCADKYQQSVLSAQRLPTIPTQYGVLYPAQILETSDDLLISANCLMELKNDNYARKAEIVSRVKQLEVEITLKEAEAFMMAGDGTAVVDGKTIKLSNAEMRDAYRRNYSADLRREKGLLDAELASIDVNIAATNEDRQNVIIAAECQQRKAGLQTALLNFLARGAK